MRALQQMCCARTHVNRTVTVVFAAERCRAVHIKRLPAPMRRAERDAAAASAASAAAAAAAAKADAIARAVAQAGGAASQRTAAIERLRAENEALYKLVLAVAADKSAAEAQLAAVRAKYAELHVSKSVVRTIP